MILALPTVNSKKGANFKTLTRAHRGTIKKGTRQKERGGLRMRLTKRWGSYLVEREENPFKRR